MPSSFVVAIAEGRQKKKKEEGVEELRCWWYWNTARCRSDYSPPVDDDFGVDD